MFQDRLAELRENTPSSAILIFYNKSDNKFLLEKRPTSNPVLGGEIVFPSEKGKGFDLLSTALRGIREEMGAHLKIADYFKIQPFMSDVGNTGLGVVQAFVVSSWRGEIYNKEQDKGKHIWVDRHKVMETLTYNPSKHLFWMALAGLGLLKPTDFEHAPKMPLPDVI